MKIRHKSKLFKSFALMLTIAFCFALMADPTSVSAQTELSNSNTSNESTVSPQGLYRLSDKDIPSFISQEQIEEYGHVVRVPEEEDLYSVTYLNRDGTKTAYIADNPIKFVDEAGNTEFIDLSLVENGNNYKTSANDISLTISKNYTTGVTLSYKDCEVSLAAITASSLAEGKSVIPAYVNEFNNSIVYRNVFGKGIDIEYTPLHNGVKEDILLSAYTGQNSFDFLLKTNGLRLYKSNDQYYFATNANAERKLYLGDIIAYDAAGKMCKGTIDIELITASNQYRITVSVDEAFLKNAKTEYPVSIDPSLTVSDATHGASAIIDCPVYSGRPTVNMGSALYNPIGYLDATYQEGRTAVKLSGLTNNSIYQTLSADAIEDVKFYIRDSSGGIPKPVKLYPIMNIPSWTETSLTWNGITGNISTLVYASANVGNEAWSYFDITNLVKAWKMGTQSEACGFVLQGSNPSESGNFYSSESSSTSNYPYVTITYKNSGTGGGTSFSTAPTLAFGDPVVVHTVVQYERRYFKFIPPVSGEYVFYSIYESGNPQIWLYDGDLGYLSGDNNSGGNSNFCLAADLTAGNTYYVKLGHSGTNTGMFELHVIVSYEAINDNYYIKNIGTTQYVDIHGPVAQELVHQWTYHDGDQMRWTFTKAGGGYYTIRSMYGEKKYIAISNTNVGVDNIVLISSATDYAQWKIYTDTDEYLYFTPKSALGKAMCAPNYSTGSELQLSWISEDDSNRNAWKITFNESSGGNHTHSYTTQIAYNYLHPHKVIQECSCGATKVSYSLRVQCFECTANLKALTDTYTCTVPLYAENLSLGGGVIGIFPVDCVIEYTNHYDYPFSMTYDYPDFASFASSVVVSAFVPNDVIESGASIQAGRTVEYYTAEGYHLGAQQMSLNAHQHAYPSDSLIVYTLLAIPAYVTNRIHVQVSAASANFNATFYFD